MAARWLIVKVMDEEHFDNQYQLNQLDGVDCMEVPEGRLPQWILESFDEDVNTVIGDMT